MPHTRVSTIHDKLKSAAPIFFYTRLVSAHSGLPEVTQLHSHCLHYLNRNQRFHFCSWWSGWIQGGPDTFTAQESFLSKFILKKILYLRKSEQQMARELKYSREVLRMIDELSDSSSGHQDLQWPWQQQDTGLCRHWV